MNRRFAIAASSLALLSLVPLAGVQAATVDYKTTAKCSYSATENGWASVGRAPRGTDEVVYTMRTGTPASWDASSIYTTTKARQWRVVTDPGMSFINWVTFLDVNDNVLAAQNVNLRCAGTPTDWPE